MTENTTGPVESRALGLGLLGYGFMGRAHSYAAHAIRAVTQPSPLYPRLIAICGRNAERVARARARYGWEAAVTDWRELVADPRIGLFDNVGPNDVHMEPTIAAARKGKHVLCEKPLAPTAEHALRMWAEAERAHVVHMCGFNYRFLPAVQRARELVSNGALGQIQHFRSRFLQATSLIATPSRGWRTDRPAAGGGALRDLGSHHIDLARLLVGEPARVVAAFATQRAMGDVAFSTEPSVSVLMEFVNGATGSLEASSLAGGHDCTSVIEVDGSKASLRFDLARLNELVLLKHGRRQILVVTEPDDRFMKWWYPPGHGLGWGDSFLHQMDHLLRAIAGETSVGPIGATFEDGYRCAAVCDAIAHSAGSESPMTVDYRAIEGDGVPAATAQRP